MLMIDDRYGDGWNELIFEDQFSDGWHNLTFCGAAIDHKGLRPWWVGCVTSRHFKLGSTAAAATIILNRNHFFFLFL